MFKESFKYYKSKNPPPKFHEVTDFFSLKDSDKVRKVNITELAELDSFNPLKFGFVDLKDWDVYEFEERPGLYFIKNPFSMIGQRYWIVRCLKDYPKTPNKSNLDSLGLVSGGSDWWSLCHIDNNDLHLMKKLRWVTLGYHHNWDTKVYDEQSKAEFPEDLKEMTAFVASVLGYNNFQPEAAIANYYNMDSTLSGHTDHSEYDLEAPLFSFSFGQNAIFLIGGKTKEDAVIPLLLRSGDIIVMSKESRLCYHGVPRILPSNMSFDPLTPNDYLYHLDKPLCLENINYFKTDSLWENFSMYIKHSRINVNVRQLFKK